MQYLKTLALSAVILALVSCAKAPTVGTYQDYQTRYLSSEKFERVIFDFKDSCNDEGLCYVSAETIDAAVIVITKLNDTVDFLVGEVNKKTESLIECKMSGDELRTALFYKEQQREREGWINTGKTIGLAIIGAAICK